MALLEKTFYAVLGLSLRACPLILTAALAHLVLRRAPRPALCALWGVVGLRLVCPLSFPVVLPTVFPLPSKAAAPAGETALPPGLTAALSHPDVLFTPPQAAPSAGPGTARAVWPAVVWAAGIALLIGWSAVSMALLCRRLRGAAEMDWPDGYAPEQRAHIPLLLCPGLPTAFVFGLARPRVYVPDGLTDRQLACVLCHECAHLRRRDYLFKPLAALILCLHWFNPLAWLAFAWFVRDMEWACDEAALRRLGVGAKKEYSAALLTMARPHTPRSPIYHPFTGAPFAFGEGAVKGRVINVLRYKKSALWVSIITVTLLVAVIVVLLMSPTHAAQEDVSVTFPTYQDGRNEYNAAIYDTAPFTVGLSLPQGWHFTKPDELNALPWTPMLLRDAQENIVGTIGFGRFDPVPDLPAEEEYKAVFAELRLGSMRSWCNEYTPVRSTDTQESSVSQCIASNLLLIPCEFFSDDSDPSTAYLTPESEEQQEFPFPCAAIYDRTLKVYAMLTLAPGELSEDQLMTLAETMTLKAAE